MPRFRRTSGVVARAAGAWLPLLLLFVVLVPSVALLWFVQRAARNEELAVRQHLTEAYRANLVLAQERLQNHWLRLAADLATRANDHSPAEQFAQIVSSGAADSAVCFDPAGQIAYPDTPVRPSSEAPTPEWQAANALELRDPAQAARAFAAIAAANDSPTATARALQAQCRCLLRSGDRAAALTILTEQLAADRFRAALDAQGRLIAPNALLLALELLRDEAPERSAALRAQLAARAIDYGDQTLASPQRRLLLRELRETSSEPALAAFLAAEDLAADWLGAKPGPNTDSELRPSAQPGIWQLSVPGARVALLFRAEGLPERLARVVAPADLPADARIEFLEPRRDSEAALLSIPAGATMPGWRLALVLRDRRAFDAAGRARAGFYLWIGGLAILALLILATLIWGMLRRQLALTRLRNDLVANVTHELKTPLSAMRLFVETLLDAPPPLDERTTREYLQLIAQENVRLSRLIDNFLTFSRIERNKYAYSFDLIAAATVAERAAGVVRERFQHAGTFAVVIDPALPDVSADADALVTALVNLLDNAWKYSGETRHVVLSARRHEDRVEFAVRDNGIGLAPRDRRRIFQRFYQVRPQGSPVNGGCGLGLSIVRAIVVAHRGRIAVESELGRGSTFIISLPIAPPTS
ncbi:MAG TPA: HAMP domain-containing sensor histidine kinase [Opitutaceae bacterium]|nr:HAMP domain-containing sensor histidine kinase [Opitutaceae bacterium]